MIKDISKLSKQDIEDVEYASHELEKITFAGFSPEKLDKVYLADIYQKARKAPEGLLSEISIAYVGKIRKYLADVQ